jgi:hypothetical protein
METSLATRRRRRERSMSRAAATRAAGTFKARKPGRRAMNPIASASRSYWDLLEHLVGCMACLVLVHQDHHLVWTPY